MENNISDAIKNRNLSILLDSGCIDSKTYGTIINATLPNCILHITTIGDLLSTSISCFEHCDGIGKSKSDKIGKLKQILDELVSQDKIQEIVNKFILPHSISNIKECSLVELSNAFIKDWLEFLPKVEQNERILNNKRASIDYRFLRGYNNGDIARATGQRNTQNVDNIITNFIEDVLALVNGSRDSIRNYSLSEDFKDRINELRAFVEKCPTDEEFYRHIGATSEIDNGAILFLLDITQKKIVCQHQLNWMPDQFISGIDAIQMREIWIQAYDFCNKNIAEVSETELKKHLKGDREAVSEVLKMIRQCSLFKCVDDTIRLSWDALSGVQEKIERILYEQHIKNPTNAALRLTAIRDEYNRRATAYNVRLGKNDIVPRTSDKIQSVRPGYWEWINKYNPTTANNLRSLVHSYIASKQWATIDEVIDHIKTTVPNAAINSRSIRAYLLEKCYYTTEEVFVYKSSRQSVGSLYHFIIDNIQIINDLKEIVPQGGCGLSFANILSKYESKFCKLSSESILRNALSNDSIFIKHGDSRRSRRYSLHSDYKANIKKLEEAKSKARKQGPKAEHTKHILDTAIGLLRTAPGHCMLLQVLTSNILTITPKGFNRTGIYKILDNTDYFHKEGSSIRNKTIALSEQYIKQIETDVERKSFDDSATEESTAPAKVSTTKKESSGVICFCFDYKEHGNHLKTALKQEVDKSLYLLEKNEHIKIDYDYAWGKMIEYTNVQNESLDGAYRRLFSRLYIYRFGRTNRIERFDLHRELVVQCEAYLRTILDVPKSKDSGLGKLVNLARSRDILPKYQPDSWFSKAISKFINDRNDLSHDAIDTLSDAELFSQIQKAMVIYLCIAQNAPELPCKA